jgi:WD40 repeat protein
MQVVDLATGAVSRTFQGDTEPITSIAVSPNGRHIFAASRSLVTKCWDLQTGQCHRTWRVRRPLLALLQPGAPPILGGNHFSRRIAR